MEIAYPPLRLPPPGRHRPLMEYIADFKDYHCKCGSMPIPWRVLKDHLIFKDKQDIKLKSGNHEQMVTLLSYEERPTSYLSKGWPEFAVKINAPWKARTLYDNCIATKDSKRDYEDAFLFSRTSGRYNATWIIHYEERGGHVVLCSGWDNFCNDVGIRRSAVIIWEFVPTHVFNVTVAQGEDDEEGGFAATDIGYPYPLNEDLLPVPGDLVPLLQFSLIVKDYDYRSRRLRIPRDGILDYIGSHRKQEVWIQVGQLPRRGVTLLNYAEFGGGQCYLSRGWMDIVTEFLIEVDDVVIFDLHQADGNENLLKLLLVKGVV